MTVASEITRLQNAKSDICTAIENKGVTVGNITLDNYAECIDAIQQGGGGASVDLLVVAGGGSGGKQSGYGGGGGGAGGVVSKKGIGVDGIVQVRVGKGGSNGLSGDDSFFGEYHTYGGGAGGTYYYPCNGNGQGAPGGSAGGASATINGLYCFLTTHGIADKNTLSRQGCDGGGYAFTCCNCAKTSAGGGGASSNGCTPTNTSLCADGGEGICSDIEGTMKCYAGGGGGGPCGCGKYGGGNGTSAVGCPATTCGSGGGGSGYCKNPGKGGDGIVVVRYKTDSGIDATGGCKYECGDYTIHCFTEDGYFKVGNPQGCFISYLVVGGGGSGLIGGGGGGEVLYGTIKVENPTFNVVVGTGGVFNGVCNGGNSCFGNIVAHGGYGTSSCYGGNGGPGTAGGAGAYNCGGGGGGGNSVGCGGGDGYRGYGGLGGIGKLGYGGGGTGGVCGSYSVRSCKVCGGGGGAYRGNRYAGDLRVPSNCGGGGGGACCNCCYADANGACGVVDVCYPSDGSYGFTTATGGDSCYLCNGFCVHRFTTDGTFTITG